MIMTRVPPPPPPLARIAGDAAALSAVAVAALTWVTALRPTRATRRVADCVHWMFLGGFAASGARCVPDGRGARAT